MNNNYQNKAEMNYSQSNAKRIFREFDVTTLLSQRYSQEIWPQLNSVRICNVNIRIAFAGSMNQALGSVNTEIRTLIRLLSQTSRLASLFLRGQSHVVLSFFFK